MKLASLKKSRDGELVVVSKDLSRMIRAGEIASTLQSALDTWATARPRLTQLADTLESGAGQAEPFD